LAVDLTTDIINSMYIIEATVCLGELIHRKPLIILDKFKIFHCLIF